MQNVSIFFAKVVETADDKKLYRIKATVAGYTDQVAVADLPWYYPFYGIDFLPVKGDAVPLLVFNANFSTGMYLHKCDPVASVLSDDDYLNYLEIFKRTVSDKNVELSYTPSLGINLINGKGGLNLQDTQAQLRLNDTQVLVTDGRVDIGKDPKSGQATVLGDDNVKALQNALKEISTLRKVTFNLFNVIKTACSSGILAPIRISLSAAIPVAEEPLPPQEETDMNYLNTIQSKITFIQ
jgi:hypothetical protein